MVSVGRWPASGRSSAEVAGAGDSSGGRKPAAATGREVGRAIDAAAGEIGWKRKRTRGGRASRDAIRPASLLRTPSGSTGAPAACFRSRRKRSLPRFPGRLFPSTLSVDSSGDRSVDRPTSRLFAEGKGVAFAQPLLVLDETKTPSRLWPGRGAARPGKIPDICLPSGRPPLSDVPSRAGTPPGSATPGRGRRDPPSDLLGDRPGPGAGGIGGEAAPNCDILSRKSLI